MKNTLFKSNYFKIEKNYYLNKNCTKYENDIYSPRFQTIRLVK